MNLRAKPKVTIRAYNASLNALVARGLYTVQEAIRARGTMLRLMTRATTKRTGGRALPRGNG